MPTIDRITSWEQAAETAFTAIPQLAHFPTANKAKYSCPWLHYWLGLNQPAAKLEGIFMMQDWGFLMSNTTLDEEIREIKSAFSGQHIEDSTLDNLAMTGWASPIRSGRWLVTNAVWALRTGENKCGYLGNEIHMASYRVWSQIIDFFAQQNSKLNLVVAGDWARFSEQRVGFKIELQKYMARWEGWAIGGSSSVNRWDSLQGFAYHCHHPSTWRWTASTHNPQNGPP